MNDLIGLSIDLQIALVAGYLGYKTSTVGKKSVDRTEDFILKTLAYGMAARLFSYIFNSAIDYTLNLDSESSGLIIFSNSIIAVIAAVSSALFWRTFLSKKFSNRMRAWNFYKDDHQSATWDTLCEAHTVWDCVQVHLNDGRVLESHFSLTPASLPLHGITLNEDGIALYVSRIFRQDESEVSFPVDEESTYSVITYVPRSHIAQIDISWKNAANAGA